MADEDPNRLTLRLMVKPIRDMFVFSGRSTRTEVFGFYLLQMAVTFCFVLVHIMLPFEWLDSPSFKGSTNLLQFLFGFPYLALFARRLHDQGKSIRWLGIGAIHPLAVSGLLLVPAGKSHGFSVSLFGWSNRPEWSSLSILLVIAALAGIFTTLILMFSAGTPGPNPYGPDPRGLASPMEGAHP